MTLDQFVEIWQTLWEYLYKFFAKLTNGKYGDEDGDIFNEDVE